MTVRLKECKWCKKIFRGTSNPQRYCSDECLIKARREQHRIYNRRARIDQVNRKAGKPLPVEDLTIVYVDGNPRIKGALWLDEEKRRQN